MAAMSYERRPALDRPPLLCAFRGWNDGGQAATLALRYLGEQWEARPFAHVDPDDFFDFQVNRPLVRLRDGVSRSIEWPQVEFSEATVGGRDVVLLASPEPNNRWRSFTETVVGAARDLGSSLLVTLGAFLTDVPHTRAVPVVGSSEDPDTTERLGLSRSDYEGPTGIVGVLHDASIRSGVPSVSLWAAVPHYLPGAPNPKAALALVERASAVTGLPVGTAPLSEAAESWEQGVNRLVEDNEELREYVARLEQAADAGAGPTRIEEEMVSGEAIAAELERYLREQQEGGGAP